MDIGILGTGDVGKALAKGFLERGHDVMMGSRDADNARVRDWVATAGDKAKGGTFEDAARFGEVVVLATHGMANEEVLKAVGPKHLVGKVLIDATNPLVFADNAPPRLGIHGDDSGGEQVQRLAPEAHVVKCFNTIGNPHMVAPQMSPEPTMFIAGNDAGAKEQVQGILESFGWKSVQDVGGIEASRELESLCMLWVRLWMVRGNGDHGFRIVTA